MSDKEYKKYNKGIERLLSEYRQENFNALNDAYCREKNDNEKYVLPSICGMLNLLETYRDDFLRDELSNIAFHGSFHSLRSSQAMCINFFFPLIVEKKLDIILNTAGIFGEEVSYNTAEFEKKSSIDNEKAIVEKAPELKERRKPVIPTSFDFYFETKSKKKFYFEIKYTEEKFGSAEEDKQTKTYLPKYDVKYKKIYQEAANGKIQPEFNNVDSFLGHYQIMRNLIHVDNDSYVIFIIPKDNEPVYSQAKQAKNFVVEEYKENIKVITWDDLYDIIEKHKFSGTSKERLNNHFENFMKKYKLKI